jgi:hypothetical protein
MQERAEMVELRTAQEEPLSQYSLVDPKDKTVRHLVFRQYKGMHRPMEWSAYHFYVGKERWGFVTHTPGRNRQWTAVSFSELVPKGLRSQNGFATRHEAGCYIVKTYGYWEDS